MASDRGNRKEKNQNIQVFVRLRPINQRERDIKSLGVVEVVNNKEVVVRQSAQTSLTKKFTFDRAFGPNAKQVEVYQEVVSPLIEEVLAGYNCTVFAYGQTGTGKTHTMVGEYTDDQSSWQSDPLAGIIPRVLSQLFDELRLSNTEFTVRVSYLELYNEELFDLLSSSEDNSKLRIYEDVTRKGANIVNGLEEITVYNKKEVYKIMAQGQDRKRMASTLMNAQSSRSHTVFTIVVHMKENSPEGEELVKIGKLNLVDLAGSENISKAGSEGKKERARECVNINQSLLTLGRVITALVERHPHIPYRESKLTRILQESLGGRTKTSIIATVSPGHKDLEETMSTLEYAHRAKNIQNKPEVNQKMTKKAILKEFAEEIDRLKRDLQASRDKNGVYLATETYQEITFKAEEQNKEIQNLILQKRAMEDERDKMENIFKDLNETIKEKEYKLETTKTVLEDTRNKLCKTKNALETTTHQYEEQKHLVSKQVETENVLSQQATTLLQTVDLATNHVSDLHNSVDKRKQVEHKNVEVTRSLREHSDHMCEDVSTRAVRHAAAIEQRVQALWDLEENHNKSTVDCQNENIQSIDKLVQLNTNAMEQIKLQTKQCEEQLSNKIYSSKQCIEKELSDNEVLLQKLMHTFMADLVTSVGNAQDIDVKGRQKIDSFVQQWYKGASTRVTSLTSLHSRHGQQTTVARQSRDKHVRHVCDTARQLADQREQAISNYVQIIEKEIQDLKQKLNMKLEEIETERQETQAKLEEEKKYTQDRLAKNKELIRYAQEERKNFIESLARIEEEKKLLENKLSLKVEEIEINMRVLEDRVHRCKIWQESQMEEVKKEYDLAELLVSEHEKQSKEIDILTSKYNKEFTEGTDAISIDMEALTKSISDIVEHNHSEMMRGITLVQDNAGKGVSDVISAHKECSNQLQNTSKGLLQDVLDINTSTTSQLISHVEIYNETAKDRLSTISSSLSNNISVSLTHTQNTQDILNATNSDVTEHVQGVQSIINEYRKVEDKLLGEEFSVYSPTGKTPLRQQYRYPRMLAATSPHDRILSRYRASRNDDMNNKSEVSEEQMLDVMIIEGECQTPTGSDSETSRTSEHMFTEPTPRTNGHALTKCISESDIIYTTRNGKENTEQLTGSIKRPSKLPTSQKKPLSERNTSVN